MLRSQFSQITEAKQRGRLALWGMGHGGSRNGAVERAPWTGSVPLAKHNVPKKENRDHISLEVPRIMWLIRIVTELGLGTQAHKPLVQPSLYVDASGVTKMQKTLVQFSSVWEKICPTCKGRPAFFPLCRPGSCRRKTTPSSCLRVSCLRGPPSGTPGLGTEESGMHLLGKLLYFNDWFEPYKIAIVWIKMVEYWKFHSN